MHDIKQIEALQMGDRCEFRFPARPYWNPGVVMRNGGSGYWTVQDEDGQLRGGLYIEHIRVPGTDPWKI